MALHNADERKAARLTDAAARAKRDGVRRAMAELNNALNECDGTTECPTCKRVVRAMPDGKPSWHLTPDAYTAGYAVGFKDTQCPGGR